MGIAERAFVAAFEFVWDHLVYLDYTEKAETDCFLDLRSWKMSWVSPSLVLWGSQIRISMDVLCDFQVLSGQKDEYVSFLGLFSQVMQAIMVVICLYIYYLDLYFHLIDLLDLLHLQSNEIWRFKGDSTFFVNC